MMTYAAKRGIAGIGAANKIDRFVVLPPKALATRRWSSVKVIYAAYPVGWAAAMLLLLVYTLCSLRRMWAETESGERRKGTGA